MFKSSGSIVLSFWIKKKNVFVSLRIESRLEKKLMGINCISLAVSLGEGRRCSTAVVGLDLVLVLSMVRSKYFCYRKMGSWGGINRSWRDE